MNILLKKSCLLNIHEELEEKEVMNMDKSNLAGFLRKEIGRHSVLLLCSSIYLSLYLFTFNSAMIKFTGKLNLRYYLFLLNYQCFSIWTQLLDV